MSRRRSRSDEPIERSLARLRGNVNTLATLVQQRAARVAVLALQDYKLTRYTEEKQVDVRRSVRLVPLGPGHVLGVAPDQAAVDELVSSIKTGLERKDLVVEWEQSPTEEEFARLNKPEWAAFRQALESGDSQSPPTTEGDTKE